MATDPNYWRSLAEYHDSNAVNEAKANEFMAGVTDPFDVKELAPMSRKRFLALLTASAAFAAAGCSGYRDKGEIVPYTKKPEEVTPGVSNLYASTCTGCAQSCGILIKTREGRPIKVDGNPDHPLNAGKICAKGQASILNLYDPYRMRAPRYGDGRGTGEDLTWDIADGAITRQLSAAVREGREIALLMPPVLSPTTATVLDDFRAKFSTVRAYGIALFSDAPRRAAWEACYGTARVPSIAWGEADVILALEADLLATDGAVMEQIRGFVKRRDTAAPQRFNRLYCVEGNLTLTGANADVRLRLRPDAQMEFVLAMLHEIAAVRLRLTGAAPLARLLEGADLGTFASRHGIPAPTLAALVNDLLSHRGRAIVYAGASLDPAIHTIVNYLNEILGNSSLYRAAQTAPGTSSSGEIAGLVDRMKRGKVGAVIHAGVNPVYHLPRPLDYAGALKSVPLSVSLVESEDETSRLCTYQLPAHHAFESWGDYSVREGVLSLQQPVIAPLYDTRQKEAVLLAWLNGPYKETIYHEYLKRRWQSDVYKAAGVSADADAFWFGALHDGVIVLRTDASSRRSFDLQALDGVAPAPRAKGYGVTLAEAYFVGDGAYANNGWLQEIPHPVTKVVWDNYAALSPATALELGLVNSDLIEVVLPHGKATLPAFVQPGHADGCVTVALGYGRWHAGPVGSGVGADAVPLLSAASWSGGKILSGASISKTVGRHELVSTQEQHALDDTFLKDLHLKRKIIREGTVAEYARDPKFLREEAPPLFNIAPGVEYKGVKWAMAIDLNKCIGCNACVAGCNVENNIPVVGKEQAGRGRAMHWIRIDRYYSGTAEAPAVSHQPMLCQHCDNAPCENVCPVSATNHSPDGLNQMVYNRCVGTKYCANNCPYKVRRFNFFNWRDDFGDGYYQQEPVSLVNNPEVTVRSRGVMEKCTFCVQRIMEARQHAAEQGREVKGSDVRTACQEACPATAIEFGDMNDPTSRVAALRAHDLGYNVLEELNARPNVTYLSRLRNHPETKA
jgi:MoCo/4Fe-4S cofactor protein with predicted Tat translocation signal